ncbi:MAG: hypothetical protein ABIT08_10350 [Bacteroidia bacterium]
MRKKILPVFILILFFLPGTISSVFSQNNLPYDDENFVYSVKQIDEFIERFNKTPNSFLISYLKSKFPENDIDTIDRKKFILNLFNLRNATWDSLRVRNFVNHVTDTVQPSFIQFYDDNWYALLKCKVVYRKVTQDLDLILKIEPSRNNSSKWVIVSAKADFLNFKSKYENTKVPVPVYCGSDLRDPTLENKFFLDPMAYGTDFMCIDEPFEHGERFKDYLYSGRISSQITKLIQEIKKNNVVFKQVNSVSYHFLNVPGWLFICEYFSRSDRNSGWLISNLYPLTEAQKKLYLREYLNIPDND